MCSSPSIPPAASTGPGPAEDPLLELLKEHSYTRFWKVLLCAPDVEQNIRDKAVKGPYGRDEEMLLRLMGIDVVIAEDAPPGSWRLVRHDACEVHYPRGYDHPELAFTSHEECSILGESS